MIHQVQQRKNLPPGEQFLLVVDEAGLKTFAVQRDIPKSRTYARFATEAAVEWLVSFRSE